MKNPLVVIALAAAFAPVTRATAAGLTLELALEAGQATIAAAPRSTHIRL